MELRLRHGWLIFGLLVLPSVGRTAVTIPDCSSLAKVNFEYLSVRDEFEGYFSLPLQMATSADFDEIRRAFLRCSNEAVGNSFGRMNKEYLVEFLDKALKAAAEEAANLRKDADVNGDIDSLIAQVKAIGAKLSDPATANPQAVNPVLSDDELAALTGLERRATQISPHDGRVKGEADGIRLNNRWAVELNQAYQSAQKSDQDQLESPPSNKHAPSVDDLMAFYTMYVTSKMCAEHGASFNDGEIARLETEVKKMSDASSVPQSEKDRIWKTLQVVVAANEGQMTYESCAANRQQLFFILPQIFVGASGVEPNPFH